MCDTCQRRRTAIVKISGLFAHGNTIATISIEDWIIAMGGRIALPRQPAPSKRTLLRRLRRALDQPTPEPKDSAVDN